MRILTISSDLHRSSPKLALIKCGIAQHDSLINVVDLAHTQYQFNLIETSLFIKYNSSIFPSGTVHLILCDLYENFDGFFLLGLANGQFFIAPNHGVLTLIHPVKTWEWVKKIPLDSLDYLSIIRSLMNCILQPENHVALAHLEPEQWRKQEFPLPVIMQKQLRGNFIWVDGFGNAVSNIDRSVFESMSRAFTSYRISFGHAHSPIQRIVRHYGEVAHGEELALFNSMDLLEIAINHGSAARLLGLRSVYDKQLDRHHYHTSLQVEFYP